MMQLQATDQYVKVITVCMTTRPPCEASINAEETGLFPRQNLVDECRDCAKAFLTLLQDF